jgi:hypothetical protein
MLGGAVMADTHVPDAVTTCIREVDFGADGGSAAVRGAGWSAQEPDSAWSVGPCSVLTMPAWPDDRAATLELDVTPCLAPPLVTAQYLCVRLNGVALGWQRIEGPARLRCPIRAGMIEPGVPVVLSFEHPGFLRLDRLGAGADDRPLALRFFALRLHVGAPAAESTPLWHPAAVQLDLIDLAPALSAESAGFRLDGTGAMQAELREGWHRDEDGLVWTSARVSRLVLPLTGPVPSALRIGLAPLLTKDLLPAQRLAVIGGGMLLGQYTVRAETALCVPLPAGPCFGEDGIALAFVTPDALPMRLFDHDRPELSLGFVIDWIETDAPPARLHAAASLRGDGLAEAPPLAVSQRFLDVPTADLHARIEEELGVKAAELMRGFESLGDNCAFGLAQRKAGAEVLGLLRFANTPLRALLRGLADGFKAALAKAEIEIYLHPDGNPREYMLRIARYGIRWHTMVHEPDAEAAAVERDQVMKLGFLRRKFEEGLRGGRKISTLVRSEPQKISVVMPGFGAPDTASASHGMTQVMPAWDPPRRYEVVPPPLTLAEAQTVLLELNRRGANTLMYFVPATPGRPAGTVELLAPGLMRASMASFVILTTGEHPNDFDWVRVAANAWLLNRDANAVFRQKE